MFYRAVCLLLLPLLVLQGMCLTLSQGGPCFHQPAGHHQAPHFHLCALGWHHHDATHDDEDDAADQSSPATGHEDDAVYLTAPVMLASRSPLPQIGADNFATSVPTTATSALLSITGSAALSVHPPPLLLHEHCPLYLRTLTLLI
ncbi:hypothetical protein AYO44_15630 [Planctomycetaceae bacterium SCGC AG-212-F19]|nr:hypothetical protein AYO44_15630 [Planctomycetaceae bacterium SCGC AG-212-F19]